MDYSKIEYEFTGITAIDSPIDGGEKLAEYLRELADNHWFTYANRQNHSELVQLTSENMQHINQLKTDCQKCRSQVSVPYFYTRTVNHGDCSCCICNYISELNNPKLWAIISQLTGRQIIGTQGFHASRFMAGDFLGYHTDLNPGRDIACVINFTKDWLPEYGGALRVHKNDGTIREFPPTFNQMVLFDITAGRGRAHYVTDVKDDINAKAMRLAIAGWFTCKSL